LGENLEKEREREVNFELEKEKERKRALTSNTASSDRPREGSPWDRSPPGLSSYGREELGGSPSNEQR